MSGFLSALSGACIASVYAASLWFAVRRISAWPASLAVCWFGLASLARAALVGVWFFVLVRLGREVAIGGFVGFIVVRTAIVACVRG